MSSAPLALPARGVLRHSRWDALLVTLAAVHGALLLAVPAAPVVAVGVWWGSNTVAHYFLHRPFFRPRALNVLFACYLSVLLGVPQTLWRERHLAHHAGVPWRFRVTRQLAVEAGLVLALWGTLLALWPAFFLTAYLPGYLAGLGLCWVHGHYEHARGTTSHHGRLYNLLFFNDGYHVEHHAHPGEHWTRLPGRAGADVPTSRWPAVLRWLDNVGHSLRECPVPSRSEGTTLRPLARTLDGLERLVLRSGMLQRFVLARHERAFRRLLPCLPAVRRVGIVGGALFPRTLLVLRRLLPDARFVVIDRSADHIRTARELAGGDVRFVRATFDPARVRGLDLVVIPLAFVGDREALYQNPPAPAVVIHDWLWRRRGVGVPISLCLLKRLNLVMP